MKELNVVLKQHTPLLHFQYMQQGATLRASEVKPRLDRFLLEWLGEGDYDQGCQEAKVQGWIIGENALNYKLRVKPGKEEPISLDGPFPMVLSNMGRENREAVGFSMHDTVELSFLFLIDELESVVRDNAARFFARNNFGQRSSKGFGSFTVAAINGEKVEWIDTEVYEKGTWYMWYTDILDSTDKPKDTYTKKKYYTGNSNKLGKPKNRFEILFGIIDYYWKCLKSGINYTHRKIEDGQVKRDRTDRYKKAFLWTYLEGKGQTWEKRQVKLALGLEGVPAEDDPNRQEHTTNPFFARAHLGCPVNGVTYRVATGKMGNNGREQTDTIDVSITNSGGIKRIPAPITFKPVYHSLLTGERLVTVYILYNQPVIKALQGLKRDINFTFKRKDNGRNVRVNLFPENASEVALDYEKLITEFHNSYRVPGNVQKSGMKPKDYNWNDILGKDRLVKFQYVKK